LQQLDEVLVFIREELVNSGNESHKVVVVDSTWWLDFTDLERAEWGIGVNVNLPPRQVEYFERQRPDPHGKSLIDADFIYTPIFVGSDHWFAGEIDLTKWCLKVYDCNIDLNPEPLVENTLAPLTTFFPRVLSLYKPLAEKFEEHVGHSLIYKGRVYGLHQNRRWYVILPPFLFLLFEKESIAL
jgi:hypothetical protein